MARKKRAEEHENHERWLVSYADFITLLFAFFVVMYSMSSVNEVKYRVLSASMVAAFSPTTRSLNPIQVGELVRSPASPFQLISETPKAVDIAPITLIKPIAAKPFLLEDGASGVDPQLVEATEQMNEIAAEVAEFFEALIDDEQIQVRKHPLWLEIEIKSNILFGSGSATLAGEADSVLRRIGEVLKTHSNRIVVEGFTDNAPISSSIYPSNWELSSARAAMVIRTFETVGIAPQRMSSVGYGEFRPSGPNDSDAGKASNRRVIIVVMANVDGERGMESRLDNELELLLISGIN